MTGFGRTGPLFASHHISATPDIICLSKGLTGGFMPMGITATTQAIFDAFYDDDRTKMLYHGHSFTANATICAAALASLDLLLEDSCNENRQRIKKMHESFALTIKDNSMVAAIRQTGTILAIEIKTTTPSYHTSIRDKLYQFFLERKIIMRPLGNIIYILPPYCISDEQLRYIYICINDLLNELMH
jgi:adenosylmethionine-8-amino-7-oxononanoate aminotransferase